MLLLSAQLVAPPAARATAPTAIAFAEQPVRLLRGKTFYLASRGAPLQDGDIVVSGPAPIQLDGAGSATLALGPASRLHVRMGPKGSDYLLLDGWLKVQPRGAGQGAALSVGGPSVRIDPAAASVILHASPGKTELFVESGQPAVEENQPGKAARRVAVAREQYAVLAAGQPAKVLPRAPKEFLGAMPPAFFDALVAVAVKGPAAAPKLERAATFAEIAPWLADQPALRQSVQRRYFPPKGASGTARKTGYAP